MYSEATDRSNHNFNRNVETMKPVGNFLSEKEILYELSKKNIILLGIPGAGKTTLINDLQAKCTDINYISVGDISRNLPINSPERQYLNELFKKETPVGDPYFFLQLVETYIDNAINNEQGFILDGIPKKAEEIQPLKDFLAFKGITTDVVISCELPADEAYQRITLRDDRSGDEDSMAIFMNRTKIYLDNIDSFKTQLTEDGSNLIVLNTQQLDKDQTRNVLLSDFQTTL